MISWCQLLVINFVVLVNYTVKDNSHISLPEVYVAEGLTSVKQIDGRLRG